MSIHAIRLHGPWQLVELSEDADSVVGASICDIDLQDSRRVKIPEGEFPEIEGREAILLLRSFRKPSGLTTESSLRIEIQSRVRCSSLWLNGQPINTPELAAIEKGSSYSWTIPVAIADQNRLGIVIRCAELSSTAPPIKSVQLQILDSV